MMKYPCFQPLVPIFIALLLSLTACNDWVVKGSGDLLSETRTETDFHAISVSVSGKIEVQKGDYKIEIEVEESLLPYLETKVRNGRLDVYFSRAVRDVDDLKIVITAPNLDGFELNGSGTLIAWDSLSGNQLNIDISGSGDMEFKKVDFQTIKSEISGSGNLYIAGIAEDLEFDISGSGDLNSVHCPVKNANIEVSGSGTVRCDVSNALKADISGSGTIYYKGNPTVTVDISGSGKLKKL